MTLFRRSISCYESATESDVFEKNLSLSDHIRLIFASSKRLDRCLDSAMDSYRNNNYMTKAEVDWISRFNSVLSLPIRKDVTFVSGYPNLDQHLMQDHHDLSVHLAYIQYSKEQQTEFDEHDLKAEFKEVKLGLKCLLDHIETMLTRRRTPVTHSVDSSAIPRGLKNFRSPKLRYRRDFLTLRDTKRFVKEVEATYETLFTLMS